MKNRKKQLVGRKHFEPLYRDLVKDGQKNNSAVSNKINNVLESL